MAMGDFPVLSQIHNEVGTMALVVRQINRITDFIEAFAGTAPLPVPSAGPVAASPSPRHTPAPSPVARTAAPVIHSAAPSPAGTVAPPPSAPAPLSPAAGAPAPDTDIEETVNRIYAQLYAFVEQVATSIQENRPFAVESAFALVPLVVDTPGATDILYRKAIYTREQETAHGFASAVVLHSVNVCIYALKIGEGLRYARDPLINLGVAALLHDVGMVSLPEGFFTKGRLSEQDVQRLQHHPVDGHRILSTLREPHRWLAEVALQEHERFDGTGYPSGLRGEQINDYARIVGVADFYAGLTRSRPERRGLLPFEAVKEIIQTHKQKFDPRVVRVLLTKLSAFPIGSLVKLNSGASGRVVATDEGSPLRPDIQVLYDAQGRPVSEERVIRLREYPILHITDAIYEEDLQGR
jgi:HD-GYP domain-containing protein (c-di-GMP phosphodiesterase class II)